MSISEPKVGTSVSGPRRRPSPATPTCLDPATCACTHPRRRATPTVPYRTITDSELTLVQISCDFVCACIALPLALLLLAQVSSVSVNAVGQLMTNLEIDSLFPVAVVVALASGGVYRVTHRSLQPSAFLEIRELCFGVGAGCVLTLALGAVLHGTFRVAEPFPTQLVTAVIVTVAVITVGRIILRYFLHTLTTTRVLVVGGGTTADRIMLSVRQDPGMTLVGRAVDGETVDAGAIGRVTDLPELCQQLDVHRILVAANDRFSSESMDIYRQLQEFVHIAMVPRYYELISWRSRLTDLSGMPFLEIAQPHLSSWDRFMKRGFDLCVSSAIPCSSRHTLLLVVAAGVKLSSPGPVFFRQVRLGRGAQPFTVTKFRSMTIGTKVASPAEPEPDVDDSFDANRPLHELHKKKKDEKRPHHPLRRLPTPDRHRRDSSVHQRLHGRHVRGWAAAVHPERGARAGVGNPALRGAPGHHRPVAGLGPQRSDPERPGATRLPLCGVVVAVVGPQDHVRDAQDDGPRHRRLLTVMLLLPTPGSLRGGRISDRFQPQWGIAYRRTFARRYASVHVDITSELEFSPSEGFCDCERKSPPQPQFLVHGDGWMVRPPRTAISVREA